MAVSKNLNVLWLVVILVLTAAVCPGISRKGWPGCASYRGYCREACFPREKSLGSTDCPKGLVCCMSGTRGHIGAPLP
uniref:Uncharacterized protein n=1 Tax=Sphaerodactylus townsendi TaxID=933632 RepID=A0ACB8FF26_9SAUR